LLRWVKGRVSGRAKVYSAGSGETISNSAPDLTVDEGEACSIQPSGAWTVANVEMLEHLCAGIQPRLAQRRIRKIDLGGITALDTVGAWLIEKLARSPAQAAEPEMTGLPPAIPG